MSCRLSPVSFLSSLILPLRFCISNFLRLRFSLAVLDELWPFGLKSCFSLLSNFFTRKIYDNGLIFEFMEMINANTDIGNSSTCIDRNRMMTIGRHPKMVTKCAVSSIKTCLIIFLSSLILLILISLLPGEVLWPALLGCMSLLLQFSLLFWRFKIASFEFR